MKLLMVTRKVDMRDSRMGFFYQWIRRMGEKVDKLYVISWQAGDRGELPDNVEVIFLPHSKLMKVITLQSQLFKILPEVDGVFCHMNPEYTILSAILAKIFRRRIVSWYTHRAITIRRRLMELLTTKILTASSSSFRQPLFKDKVLVTGHGIDTNSFYSIDSGAPAKNTFDLLSIGRISPTKDYESIIKAINILDEWNIKNVKLTIVGDAGLKSDLNYLDSLKGMVEKMNLSGRVEFKKGVPNIQIRGYLWNSDLFINLSGTGSLDKAVLEAMACRRLVLTSNEAFKEVLPPELIIKNNNPEKLAEKIRWIMQLSDLEKTRIQDSLRVEVEQHHNLNNLIQKIVDQFK